MATQVSGISLPPTPVTSGCSSIVRPHDVHHFRHREGQTDPLVVFEHHMLAHPSTHSQLFHRPHTGNTLAVPSARLQARHTAYRSPSLPVNSPALTPSQPSPVASPAISRSPSPEPEPEPAARRCMTAMASWTPRSDRRASFDGQAYRRAQMMQSTGINQVSEAEVDKTHDKAQTAAPQSHRLKHAHTSTGSCSSYEINRGFSECLDGFKKEVLQG